MKCGIKEKGKPACDKVLEKRKRDGEMLCPVHCRAKTTRGLCKLHHYTGGVRCDRHGGKSKKGLSHPGIKTGEHANPRYLGILRQHDEESAQHYEERAKDRTRHSLEPEINMLDVRAEEILRQVKSGEYRSCTDLLKLAEAVVAAQIAKDRGKSLEAWSQLMQALKAGKAQERGWDKFDQLAWQRKPRLVEAEAKRKLLQQEVYERRSVVELLQAVAALVKRTVKDKDEADAIFTGINRLAGSDGAGRLSGQSASTRRSH